MRKTIGVSFTALFALAVSAMPSSAGEAESAAWSAIQKINEMAEEARSRCASESAADCAEASAITAVSFTLIRDANKCDAGRYPMTCDRFGATLAEIDGLYMRYLEETGPNRVAANRDRLRTCHTLPMFGTCDSGSGVVQTQLNAQ